MLKTEVKIFKTQIVMKYVSILFVCFVLANARIGEINPFLFAFFFACVYVGLEEKVISGFVLCSSLICSPCVENLWTTVCVIFVGLLNFYLHKIFKRKQNIITNFFVLILSFAVYMYYNYLQPMTVFYFVALALVCLYVFVVVLQVVFLKKNCFKLTLDEAICFMFMIACLGLGLGDISIFNFQLFRFVLMLTILVCSAINSFGLTYAVTLSFALGVSLSLGTLNPIAEFAILTLMANIFPVFNKYKSVAVINIVEVFLQIYFWGVENLLWQIAPIALASIVFLLLPNKYINSLCDLVYVKKSEMTSRSLINTTRRTLKRRVTELSNVFLDMKQIHLNMLKNQLTRNELKEMFLREILNTNCKDCLDKTRCSRSLGTDNISALETLVDTTLDKGKVTLLDIPQGITNRCSKVNYLIGMLNRLYDEYSQYRHAMADVNNVKILLAEQMGAVSNLLLDLGQEIDTNVTFDIARENKIIARLLSLNIQCREVLIYTEKDDNVSAVVVVKAENAQDERLKKVVSEILKCPVETTKIQPLENSGFCSVTLSKVSKYDCMFGLSACSKNGNVESGDCHSVIRLNNNRFLLALCDGMGTGSSASKISALTLGLIENFYRAGFDNETILSSVNKLLAINNQENYSTLDVCVLDLEKEFADFVKVGAPIGVIKHEGSTEMIECGSLPIGTLDEITPTTKHMAISSKDMTIMVTDGVIDAFGTEDNFVEFCSHLVSTNPQMIADSILNEALHRSEMSAKDDMTVLVSRMFLKNNKPMKNKE